MAEAFEGEEDDSPCKIDRVTREVAILVRNLRSYFEQENRDRRARNLSRPALRVSDALNLSPRTVSNIASRSLSSFPKSGQRRSRQQGTTIPQAYIGYIRERIHSLYRQKQCLSVSKLHSIIRAEW